MAKYIVYFVDLYENCKYDKNPYPTNNLVIISTSYFKVVSRSKISCYIFLFGSKNTPTFI